MSRKILVTVGFLPMLAATLALSAFDSFAADAKEKKETPASESKQKASATKRKDVIETPSKKAQPDSSKGDVYPSTGGERKDVQGSIK